MTGKFAKAFVYTKFKNSEQSLPCISIFPSVVTSQIPTEFLVCKTSLSTLCRQKVSPFSGNHCALNQFPASTKTAFRLEALLCDGVNLVGLNSFPLERPAKADIATGI